MLERSSRPMRWTLDRSTQLDVAHRPDKQVVARDQLSELGEGRAMVEVVGADGEDDGAVGTVRCGHDATDERRLPVTGEATRKELLELIDEHQPSSGSECRHVGTATEDVTPALRCGRRDHRRPTTRHGEHARRQRRQQAGPHER